jgi:hypothetical protein
MNNQNIRAKSSLPAALFFLAAFIIPFLTACQQNIPEPEAREHIAPEFIKIADIDSYDPATACRQAVEVLNSNRFSKDFFMDVFRKILANLEQNKNEDNYNIVWDSFVVPLQRNDRIPPDLVKRTWNEYFSLDFISFAGKSLDGQCSSLTQMYKDVANEYNNKIIGFEVSKLGSPDENMTTAMNIYNAMWAACNPPAKALK